MFKPGDLVTSAMEERCIFRDNVGSATDHFNNIIGRIIPGDLGMVIASTDVAVTDTGKVLHDYLVLFPGPLLGWILYDGIVSASSNEP